MVPAPKVGHVDTVSGPEPVRLEELGQFGQVQVHEKQSVLRPVAHRRKTAVADGSLIDAAVHDDPPLRPCLWRR